MRLIAGTFVLAAFGAFASGCATTPAEDDPVQIKLNDIDARLTRVERIVTNQSLVELAQHLDEVQASVRQLRGRIDELENGTETLRKQQRDLTNELDKRLGTLQGGGTAGASGLSPTPNPGGPAPNPTTSGSGGGNAGGNGFSAPAGAVAGGAAAGAAGAGQAPAGQGSAPSAAGSSVEQAVYNQAFDALKASSYSIAITGFRDFLTTYPASPLAENAQYWLGEAFYVTRDFDMAATAFRAVLDKWPQSRKAPDALLKLGFTQYELKRYGDARKTLTEVTQKFPGSDAAKLATDRLARIPANSR